MPLHLFVPPCTLLHTLALCALTTVFFKRSAYMLLGMQPLMWWYQSVLLSLFDIPALVPLSYRSPPDTNTQLPCLHQLQGLEDEMNFVRIIGDAAMDVVASMQLNPNEMCQSITSTKLGDDKTTYYVVRVRMDDRLEGRTWDWAVCKVLSMWKWASSRVPQMFGHSPLLAQPPFMLVLLDTQRCLLAHSLLELCCSCVGALSCAQSTCAAALRPCLLHVSPQGRRACAQDCKAVKQSACTFRPWKDLSAICDQVTHPRRTVPLACYKACMPCVSVCGMCCIRALVACESAAPWWVGVGVGLRVGDVWEVVYEGVWRG